LWEGLTLYQLYGEAYMPWDWQPRLKELAVSLGMDLFSSPFDATAVDFLASMDMPAFKIASFELVDLPLIKRAARTGKPMIISTGMGGYDEIEEALAAAREAGAAGIALLKCTSAYPAPPEEANLSRIPHMQASFGVPVGLSDHTTGIVTPVAAVALGACIIEKHFTLSRSVPSADAAFSLEPDEFAAMVAAVRTAEREIGVPTYEPTAKEMQSRRFRRSLFVVEEVHAGEAFSERNVRSIRPAGGLHTRHYEEILGRRAACEITRGTPLSWELVEAGRIEPDA
jgi:N-acetylneuraminate synthase